MKKIQIMTDFDTTLIVQNSLNILAKKGLKYFFKRKRYGQIIAKVPIFWIRMREVYKANKYVPNIHIFDDTDLVVRKSKKLKDLPFSIFSEETVPLLDINRRWLKECLKAMFEYKIRSKKVTIVSRNGIDEVKSFLEAPANANNLRLLTDDKLLNGFKKKYGIKISKNINKKLKNKDVFAKFGIKFEIIANKFCKKLTVVDNKKGLVYTGEIEKVHKLGIIERRNKAILYEGNIVLADREERMYRDWAKKFVCVQSKKK